MKLNFRFFHSWGRSTALTSLELYSNHCYLVSIQDNAHQVIAWKIFKDWLTAVLYVKKPICSWLQKFVKPLSDQQLAKCCPIRIDSVLDLGNIFMAFQLLEYTNGIISAARGTWTNVQTQNNAGSLINNCIAQLLS